jgi:serine/threonine-protein kinase
MSCPSRDQIVQFLAGDLDGHGIQAIEDHLMECAPCDEITRQLLTDGSVVRWRELQGRATAGGTGGTMWGFERHTARPAKTGERWRQTADEPGRFSIEHLHARGGLGEVYVARDHQFGRQVALKQLQPDNLERGENHRRFLREAEITGRLEHPGIVPVYSLGRSSSGQPYYAMRFIRGDTLRQRIVDYYDATRKLQASSRDRSLAFRKLLKHFVDACQALEYAHRQGVIHRDLKPSNIMVGDYGETLVVDWGLAKVIGSPGTEDDPVAGSAPLQATTSYPAADDGSQETARGEIMGTPAFMSPEQAAGDLDAVTANSDIYSLGATLYVLLTGQAPFDGSLDEMLSAVRAGKFPRPRERNPAASRALEAICLKAMSPRPADRYRSAADLADDMEAYLADEQVTAWIEPLTVRLIRWTRKHRTLVATSLVVLLAAAVALSGGIVLTNAKNRQIRSAILDRAHTYDQLAYEQWDKDPQRALLTNQMALELLQRSKPDDRDQAAYRTELMRISLNRGSMLLESHQIDQSVALSQQAVTLSTELLANAPTSLEYRRTRAKAFANLAIALQSLKDTEGAARYYEEARHIFRQLAQDNPTVTEFSLDFARLAKQVGHLQVELGRYAAAHKILNEASQILQEVLQDNPKLLAAQLDLAEVWMNLAYRFQRLGDSENAIREITKSQDLLKTLLGQDSSNVEIRLRYVDLLLQLADVHGQGDPHKMLETHEDALRQQRLVAEAMPLSDFQREKLSNMLWNQADRRRQSGELAAAVSLAAERRQRWPEHRDELYYTAWDLALTADSIGRDQAELLADQQAFRNACIDQAFSALEAAVQNGYRDAEQVRKNKAFTVLTADPRFAAILRRMK